MRARPPVVFACAAWLASAACGAEPAGTVTPVSPTAVLTPHPASRFVGTWVGSLRVDSCLGGRDCRNANVVAPFELRFERAGDEVLGLWMPGIPIRGQVQADGTLLMAGGDAPILSEVAGVDVPELRLAVDGGDVLSGTVRYSTLPPLNSERAPLIRTATLFGGVRQPEELHEPFSGRWTGYFRDQASGWSFFIDPVRELSLTLVQQGSGVTGILDMTFVRDITVAGEVRGEAAVLAGEYTTASGARIRVSDFRIERGALGQLTGSYTLIHPQASPRFDLVRVVRTGGVP